MNTKLMLIGGFCLAALPRLEAATWTVDSNPGRPADFRSLQEAHDVSWVASGDVLHLVASTVSYGDLVTAKALSIIGPGYLLNQNLGFSVAAPSARTGNIETWNQEKPNSGITIRGNYCGGNMNCDDSGDYADIQYNTIAGYLDIGGSSYAANNLIAGTLYLYHSSFGEYNWRSSVNNSAMEGAYHNWSASPYADQFVNTGSLDVRRQLLPGSVVHGTAKTGDDPGMFGGPDPYIISGLPSVPMVIGVQAPTSASAASGLPVTVTLQVNP